MLIPLVLLLRCAGSSLLKAVGVSVGSGGVRVTGIVT